VLRLSVRKWAFSLRKVACFIPPRLISSRDSAQQKSRTWVESVCKQAGYQPEAQYPAAE
jgi:hypothetical protein